MKFLLIVAVTIGLSCGQIFADDSLWQGLNGNKIGATSVKYISESITTRAEPSADILKQHFTHLFVDKIPMEQDPFLISVKNLLASAQTVGTNKPSVPISFRWCLTIESHSLSMDSTTEIYLSRHPGSYVARIGSEFYKLDEKASEKFFDQFAKLFGLEQ